MSQLTIKEVLKRFKKHHLKLMEPYKKGSVRHKIKCYCGQIFSTCPRWIFNNSVKCCGCKYKLTITTISKRLQSMGFKLIGKFQNVDTKVAIRCICGKTFHAQLANVFNKKKKHRGCGCIFKINLTHAKNISIKLGYKLISNIYRGTHFKYNFKCLKHNEIHSCTLKSIMRKHGLTCCRLLANNLDEKYVKKILKNKGFILLEKYTKVHDRHRIKCLKHNEISYQQLNGLLNIPDRGLMCCHREKAANNKNVKSGKGHYNYNPNLSDLERQKGRGLYRGVNKWRRLVLCQNGKTCLCCGSTQQIVVHHIFNWANHEHLRADVKNGCVLCAKCHRLLHKIYGYKTNLNILKKFIKMYQNSVLIFT